MNIQTAVCFSFFILLLSILVCFNMMGESEMGGCCVCDLFFVLFF